MANIICKEKVAYALLSGDAESSDGLHNI